MEAAITNWLASLPSSSSSTPPSAAARIAQTLRKSYTLYSNLLLLPGDIVSSPDLWAELHPPPTPADFEALFAVLARACRVSHVALNKPIPARQRVRPTLQQHDVEAPAAGLTAANSQSTVETNPTDAGQPTEGLQEIEEENILRAPLDFTPVHGDFGPAHLLDPNSTSPTAADFSAAFWATAKQNGLWQVWAPRWTMFSRGNISEKARLLTLPSVVGAVAEGRERGMQSTAVDLFAGIGYFAFSYAAAGMKRVVCWDLNPWSAEGLRRGAVKNRWPVRICDREECEAFSSAVNGDANVTALLPSLDAEEDPDEAIRLLVFNESNIHAPARLAALRSRLPPVRHVNCGMLPTSRASLALAAQALDPVLGGWVHVHENLGEREITAGAEGTRKAFETEWRKLHGGKEEAVVRLEFVNRLKNYAPRVIHCVIDLEVLSPPPRPE